MDVDQREIQQILNQKFDEIKERNPQFSLRAFAHKLSISSGALSQIMNGKRRVSERLAYELAEKLALSGEEMKKFLTSFQMSEGMKKDPEYAMFDHGAYAVDEIWQVFVVLNMLKLDNFEFSTSAAATLIGIGEDEVNELIEKMIFNGLLKWSPENQLERTAENVMTKDQVTDKHLVEIQHRYMDKAKAASEILVPDRDLTSIVMPVNKNNIPRAKKLIRKFYQEIAAVLEHGDRDAVYGLNVQLYPLVDKEDIEGTSKD